MSIFPPLASTESSVISTQRISSDPLLKMSKRSTTQVYGTEAGIKLGTKNPWAQSLTRRITQNQMQRYSQTSSEKNSNQPKCITQGNHFPDYYKRKSKKLQAFKFLSGINTTNSVIIQPDQNRTLGAFNTICQKYQNSESEIKLKQEFPQPSVQGMKQMRIIIKLSEELQIQQKQDVNHEINFIAASYNIFLGDQSIFKKEQILINLCEYAKNVDIMNDRFETLSDTQSQQGNYIRMCFQGRSTFMDIIKVFSEQIIKEQQLKQNNKFENDGEFLIKFRSRGHSFNPLKIFDFDNLINLTEKIQLVLQGIKRLIQYRTEFLNEIIKEGSFV